jgi:hypothetical protein
VWALEAKASVERGLAGAAYFGAVIAFLFAQEAGLRLRREERRAWWAGTGRDLINTAGLLAIAGALRLVGYPAAAALLVGGTLTLLLFGVSVFVATQTRAAHPRAWSLGAGLAVALPLLAWTREIARVFASAAAALFGAGGG